MSSSSVKNFSKFYDYYNDPLYFDYIVAQVFLWPCDVTLLSWYDFRTAEAAAPSSTTAPALQADNTATMATIMEAETATAVSEEHLSQAAVHHTAEVKTADAPVASSESSVATEATAR